MRVLKGQDLMQGSDHEFIVQLYRRILANGSERKDQEQDRKMPRNAAFHGLPPRMMNSARMSRDRDFAREDPTRQRRSRGGTNRLSRSGYGGPVPLDLDQPSFST